MRAWFVIAGVILYSPNPASSQGPRDLAFGFSGVTYLFEASDGVFSDADEHLPGAFGFRLTKGFFGNRSWGWLLDGELYLGVANRQLLDVDMPNTIFGLHAFAGPVVSLGSFQFYAAGGVNRTTVGESEIIEVPANVVIVALGGDYLSQYMAAILNARLANQVGGNVIASVPRYSEVAAAGMFGASYDFGGSGLGFRFSLEYLPIFISPTRNNFRFTLSLAG